MPYNYGTLRSLSLHPGTWLSTLYISGNLGLCNRNQNGGQLDAFNSVNISEITHGLFKFRKMWINCGVSQLGMSKS